MSGSSHNWNALFLGANAVADIMADRLNTSKKNLLDAEGKGSVAVRMALGETELVTETRDFLESHGVKLDVFGQVSLLLFRNIISTKSIWILDASLDKIALYGLIWSIFSRRP